MEKHIKIQTGAEPSMFGISKKKRFGQTSLNIPILLLVALAIIGVSAVVYNILYMHFSTVTVEPAEVQFVEGDDSSAAGASIGTNGTYVSFNSVSGWPNATRIYENIIGIKNFDSESRTIRLEFDGWSGSTSYIDYIYIKVFNQANYQQGSTVKVGEAGSSTGNMVIPANETFRVQLEIRWVAGTPSTANVSFTLRLIVEGE